MNEEGGRGPVMVVGIYVGLTCQYPHISSLGVGGGCLEYHMRGFFRKFSFPADIS